MNKNTLLLLAIGAGAVFLMSRQNAQAAMLPAGAMNPNGFPDGNEWWQAPTGQLLNNLLYQVPTWFGGSDPYPIGAMNPQGFPSPMGAPTYTYA